MANNQLQLVTFEQAKKLKEAGFDWPVELAYFNMPGVKHLHGSLVHAHEACDYPSPTVALALKWMRDVKHIDTCISPHFYEDGRLTRYETFFVADFSAIRNPAFTTMDGKNGFTTYERAESALLDELLTLVER